LNEEHYLITVTGNESTWLKRAKNLNHKLVWICRW